MRNEQDEMLDREDEARYWRTYDHSKGNCLFVLLALVAGGVGVVGLLVRVLG